MGKLYTKIVKEYKAHTKYYLLLTFLFLGATFIRVYRTDQILGFYYDQGRDALIIWDFWHNGKMFLVGPTTGIAGIFRGPWYYWLIAPFYLLGGGDPVWPANFLALTSVAAIFILFLLARRAGGNVAGIIAVTFAGFSYYLMTAARWLSNPTPMMLISMLLVGSLFMAAVKGKKKYWLAVAALLGMAMQFGSSGEFFYFPAVVVVALLYRKNFPSKKVLVAGALLVLAAFAPQIIFDVRHDGILLTNIKKFLFEEGTFKLSFWEVVKIRLPFYYSVFTSKIWPGRIEQMHSLMILVTLLFVYHFRKFWQSDIFRICVVLLVAPLVGMLFFQGNYGNVYDYYFTGYYLIFILLISVVLAKLADYKLGVIVLVVIFAFFFRINLEIDQSYIRDGGDGPTTISFGAQKRAIDWIYADLPAGRQAPVPFSEDVYVPPVIPYAYDYLFIWYGGKIKGYAPSSEMIDPLYTIYEVDPPHPERLEAWLVRQAGIGEVEKEAKFGGIVAQKRKRI